MGITAAFMVPHPPLIVPEVGRGGEKEIQETTDAYEIIAKKIAEIEPDTIIITSPHATMYRNYFHISPNNGARGDLGDFGARMVSFEEHYDHELVNRITKLAFYDDFPAGFEGEKKKTLDHGTMVPLYFIRKYYKGGKIIRIGLSGLPLVDHYKLGMYIQQAVNDLGRKAVFVASGDLSHKLQEYGPYGFAKEGPVYDARIMDTAGRAAFGEMLDFDEDFCDKAAECGHRSFVIMAGAMDGIDVTAEVLSHQDVTGVGYGICCFYPKSNENNPEDQESTRNTEKEIVKNDSWFAALTRVNESVSIRKNPDRCFLDILMKKLEDDKEKSDSYVKLARASLENYIRNKKKLDYPDGIPEDLRKSLPEEIFTKRAGAFVSIHKNGSLRGCIGTILPTEDSLAEEIIENAISAAVRDPRFDPITENELKWLDINVDVLGEPEDISDKSMLDVKRYGVIVSCGARRGLLLPDLDGVDDVDTQISIAMRKGGIRPTERYKLQRFEVVRHI
ncbi:uncharacterized protein, PH0010 family/AmmeMemoRadiSam system protein A/AmmeMemoRadiSam system protein B [Eubacterium ruminantium]|nr:uncharacterized protein, PH0010 family/AmmeMemoRadiSam system protein A/AmmeMemoRadiSam system protein B [Eubacterium ruminantium]